MPSEPYTAMAPGSLDPMLAAVPAFIRKNFDIRITRDGGDMPRHQYILRHSNGILILGITPEHPAISDGRTVQKIAFARDVPEPKGQPGFKKLRPNYRPSARVAELCCTDGSKWDVRAGVFGTLIENNPRVADRPEIIGADPWGAGHLVILAPRSGGGGDNGVEDHWILMSERLSAGPDSRWNDVPEDAGREVSWHRPSWHGKSNRPPKPLPKRFLGDLIANGTAAAAPEAAPGTTLLEPAGD